jgi:uncharacterized protein (TIGR03435 family)
MTMGARGGLRCSLGLAMVGALLCGAVLVRGQAPTPAASATKPVFEVISIKLTGPNTYPRPNWPETMLSRPGGRFVGQNVTLAALVKQAFVSPDRSTPSQVLGGPDWISATHFEIVAKLGTDIGQNEFRAQLPALIRSLLEDRFKLQAHIEARPSPVFALIKARGDGSLGPKIHSVQRDCDAIMREELAKPPAPPVPFDMRAPSPCRTANSPGKISATGITMRALASNLRTPAGRVVVDRTGLSGSFDLELQWSEESLNADGSSVFTALQEQLGLKLEAQQAPLDVVVIDHVEMPTPN